MFKVKNAVSMTLAVAGLMMASSASAQNFNATRTGPIWVNGWVEIDNTPAGGDYERFSCKVRGHGRAIQGTNTIIIDGLQALHRSSGQVPRGCHLVTMRNLPWTVTVTGPLINGVPELALASTNTLTISPLSFVVDSGCGNGTGGGSVVAGMTWTQDVVPLAGNFTDPAYSTIAFNAAPILSGPNGTGTVDCVINKGILKITRPSAPVL